MQSLTEGHARLEIGWDSLHWRGVEGLECLFDICLHGFGFVATSAAGSGLHIYAGRGC